jgi:hypothetical protein
VRESTLRKVKRQFGSFDKITKRRLKTWFDEQGYVDGTKRANIDTLSEFFKWGIQCEIFEADPTDGLVYPRGEASDRAAITDRDVAKVIAKAVAPELRCQVALMAYQGLRPQEVALLTAEGLDLRANPPALKVGRSARGNIAVLHPAVLDAFAAMTIPARGRIFPHANAGNLSQKVGRYFMSCGVSGSSISLLDWYSVQVQNHGQNFGRPNGSEVLSTTEALIIETLESEVPKAALCYRQAIRDLEDSERISFRGVGNELRAAVWEVLETKAPDKSSPGVHRLPTRKRAG